MTLLGTEKDMHGADPAKVPAKLDAGKDQFVLYVLDYFSDALRGICWVGEYGGRKYYPHSWEGIVEGIERYTEADMRHFLKERSGHLYDDGDSGLAHADMHAWNALARSQLMHRQGKLEIRRGNDIDENRKPILGTARAI